MKVTIIGSGNVAQHLIKACKAASEIEIIQVFARQPKKLTHLVSDDKIVNQYVDLLSVADVYIIAVSDSAISSVAAQLPFSNKLVVHTSGTSHYNVLSCKNKRGVFYPLQTFSKDKVLDFTSIPLCLEAENTSDYEVIKKLAKTLSKKVYQLSSEQRKKIHIAAVFVCNFVNHLYTIGQQICDENNIPFAILQPLINETAQKIIHLNPLEAQTGPAIRNDNVTITEHIEALSNENQKTIYKIITKSIQTIENENTRKKL